MLNLENLDDENVRRYMLEEVEQDIAEGKLYVSERLLESAISNYTEYLKNAIQNGDSTMLAHELLTNYCLKKTEPRKTKNGVIMVKVSSRAHETLADGEFNRFYIRGVCRKAIEESIEIEAYRAKTVSKPRANSASKIGTTHNPNKLLEDLRSNIGIDTSLGLPSGPNSGLSIRLKRV